METNHGRRTLCIAISSTVLVLVLAVVILSLTVIFKVKLLSNKVNFISTRNIAAALDLARLQLHLNLMLGIDLSLTNTNRESFKYANSSATLSYRGESVGEAPIPEGELSSGQTKRVELTLIVMLDRLPLLNSAVIGDVVAGRMLFSSYTRLSGKVRFFGVIKVHVATTAKCEFSVFLGNNTIGKQSCKYKTEL